MNWAKNNTPSFEAYAKKAGFALNKDKEHVKKIIIRA